MAHPFAYGLFVVLMAFTLLWTSHTKYPKTRTIEIGCVIIMPMIAIRAICADDPTDKLLWAFGFGCAGIAACMSRLYINLESQFDWYCGEFRRSRERP